MRSVYLFSCSILIDSILLRQIMNDTRDDTLSHNRVRHENIHIPRPPERTIEHNHERAETFLTLFWSHWIHRRTSERKRDTHGYILAAGNELTGVEWSWMESHWRQRVWHDTGSGKYSTDLIRKIVCDRLSVYMFHADTKIRIVRNLERCFLHFVLGFLCLLANISLRQPSFLTFYQYSCSSCWAEDYVYARVSDTKLWLNGVTSRSLHSSVLDIGQQCFSTRQFDTSENNNDSKDSI